jgi:CheY-like chemotaxis protein
MPQKPLILVVDDDLPILMLMRSMLREFGFETLTATTGPEALEIAQRDPLALVLVDRHMPGMSGDDLVRALRALPHDGRLPILILSGDPMTARQLREVDADGAVMKPFDVPALIEQIRSHLGATG